MRYGFRGVGRLGALLAVKVTISSAVQGAIPHSGEDAYTQADLAQDMLAAHREHLVEAYERRGVTDPAWDEDAKHLIDIWSRRWTNSMVHSMYRHNTLFARDRFKIAQRVVEAGCRDPLVLNLCGRAYAQHNHRDRGNELFREAYEALDNASWGSFVRAKVMTYRGWYLDEQEEKEVRHELELRKAWARAMMDPEVPRLLKRYIIHEFDVEDMELDELAVYREVAESTENRDPWAYHTTLGYYHIEAAWEARGGGWANSVTDEGWRGFREHLALAREQMVAAWSVDSSLPEPAEQMIQIVMGGGGAPGETERMWFERAVSAQFDYADAYHAILWSLRPRWGGSHEEIYRFGLECLETGRFDTDVPWMFKEALQDIHNDYRGDYSFWLREGVYEHLARMLDGLYSEPKRKKNHLYLRTYHAAAAWRCKRYADARQLLDDLGDQRHDRPWRFLDTTAAFAIMQTYALTGPAGEALRTADALFADRLFVQAMRVYESARQAHSDNRHTVDYAEHQLQRTRWWLTLSGGGRVSLIPDPDLRSGERIPGYIVMHGTWQVIDDQTIQAIADDNNDKGFRALIDFAPPRAFAAEGVMDFTEGPQPKWRDAGFISRYVHRRMWFGLRLFPHADRVESMSRWQYRSGFRFETPVDEVQHFRVERWRDRLSAYVGDEAVFLNAERGWDQDQRHRLGLVSTKLDGKEIMRFRKLTLEILSTTPDWYELEPTSP